MSTHSKQQVEVKLEIHPPTGAAGGAAPVTISGVAIDLHNDPKKVHQLLDLLNMPQGTEVKVLTTASSSIVR